MTRGHRHTCATKILKADRTYGQIRADTPRRQRQLIQCECLCSPTSRAHGATVRSRRTIRDRAVVPHSYRIVEGRSPAARRTIPIRRHCEWRNLRGRRSHLRHRQHPHRPSKAAADIDRPAARDVRLQVATAASTRPSMASAPGIVPNVLPQSPPIRVAK